MTNKRFLLLITFLILSLSFSFGSAKKRLYRRAYFHMGTTVEFNVPIEGESAREISKVCDIARAKISELDKLLSIFEESSAVSRINNDNKKGIVEVAPELFKLIKIAKENYILTQGAFDITVEPLTEIWGFGPEKKELPDIQTVSRILEYVGLDKIELDEENQTLIFKDPRIRIDFGGIAKGYAVDEAVRIFRNYNIKKALINMGGDLYCLGTNQDNKDWIIGIKDPENKDEILAQLKIRDKAIATSGDYENFYIYNNKRYGHIIDPRSGFTISNNLTSVTILADDCTTADALATAVFVLGGTSGLELIEKLQGVECLLVISQEGESEILMSTGMGKYLR